MARAHVAALVLALSPAAFGCAVVGTPRYVVTTRGHAAEVFDAHRERILGPAFCEPVCGFARRPSERIAGCDFIRIDEALEKSLALDRRDMIRGESMLLCELR